MKMILALDNKKVEQALSEVYVSKYELFIVETKDLVLDTVLDNSQAIVIIRDDLKGNIDILELLDKIKERNRKTNIIVIVKKISKKIKEELYSREIFNIIEGKNFKISEIIEEIDTPKILSNSKIEQSIKEKIVFVLGSSGSGKTVFTKMLAYSIAKSTKKKILVVDMDYLNPNLDLYIKENKNYSLVDYIRDVIDLNVKEIGNYETDDKAFENIKYMLNQKNIGIPNDEITLQIFQMLKGYYDYIIVDTSSYLMEKMQKIAKRLNANIIYMIEPTISLMKNLNKSVLVDSIIVLNNYRKDSDMSKFLKKNTYFKISASIDKCNNIYNKLTSGKCGKLKINNILSKLGIAKYNKFQKIIKKVILKEET